MSPYEKAERGGESGARKEKKQKLSWSESGAQLLDRKGPQRWLSQVAVTAPGASSSLLTPGRLLPSGEISLRVKEGKEGQ